MQWTRKYSAVAVVSLFAVLLALPSVLAQPGDHPVFDEHPGNAVDDMPTDDMFSEPMFDDDWSPIGGSFPFDDSDLDEPDDPGSSPDEPVDNFPPGDDTGDDDSGDGDTGDDNDTAPGDNESDDDTGDGTVTEERSVTPAPPLSDPAVVTGDGWVSYPNPRNQMPSPETAIQDPSIKVCAVLFNQANEVITGTSVPGTTITMDTTIDRYEEADPVTFMTPLDQYADLIGTSPELPEGDGYLDAECVEFHNIEEGRYTYSPPSITGEHADEIEFVGVTEYAGARPSGNPFEKEVYDFGTNNLSDGEFNLQGAYDQRHGEAIYFFRLTNSTQS